MANQLKSGALLSYLSLGLSNLIGIIYTPFMLRMLGQSEYGLFALAGSVVSYLAMLDLGFGNAIIRYTAKFRAEGNTQKCYSLFGMFLSLYTLIGLITIFIGGVLYAYTDNFFGDTMTPIELHQMRIMLILMIFNLTITFPFSIFGSIIIAHEKFVFQQVVNLIRIILHPAIMVIVLFLGYKAVAMIVVMTSVNVMILILNCIYCFKYLHIHLIFSNMDFKLLREITGYSVYMFIAIIIDKLYWSSGQFILGAVSGTISVAIYAIAIQLKNYYSTFASALSTILLPRITALTTQKDSDGEISDLFIRIGRIQFALLGFILTGFIVFGRQFIYCWASSEYSESYIIALIVIIPFTFPLLQNIGLTILQAKAKLKFRSLLCVSLGIASFCISVPLAKVYDGIGCAIGTAICIIIAEGFIMNIYYKKEIGLNIGKFWKEITKMFIPICWIPALFLLLSYYIPLYSWGKLIIGISIYTIVYAPVFYFLSLNNTERDFFKKPLMSIYHKIRKEI